MQSAISLPKFWTGLFPAVSFDNLSHYPQQHKYLCNLQIYYSDHLHFHPVISQTEDPKVILVEQHWSQTSSQDNTSPPPLPSAFNGQAKFEKNLPDLHVSIVLLSFGSDHHEGVCQKPFWLNVFMMQQWTCHWMGGKLDSFLFQTVIAEQFCSITVTYAVCMLLKVRHNHCISLMSCASGSYGVSCTSLFFCQFIYHVMETICIQLKSYFKFIFLLLFHALTLIGNIFICLYILALLTDMSDQSILLLCTITFFNQLKFPLSRTFPLFIFKPYLFLHPKMQGIVEYFCSFSFYFSGFRRISHYYNENSSTVLGLRSKHQRSTWPNMNSCFSMAIVACLLTPLRFCWEWMKMVNEAPPTGKHGSRQLHSGPLQILFSHFPKILHSECSAL